MLICYVFFVSNHKKHKTIYLLFLIYICKQLFLYRCSFSIAIIYLNLKTNIMKVLSVIYEISSTTYNFFEHAYTIIYNI